MAQGTEKLIFDGNNLKENRNPMATESEIIFCRTNDEAVKIKVLFQDAIFWMTQKKIAELFGV